MSLLGRSDRRSPLRNASPLPPPSGKRQGRKERREEPAKRDDHSRQEAERSPDSRCKQVQVTNVPRDLQAQDVQRAFERSAGRVMECALDRDRAIARLTFHKHEHAKKAVEAFDRGELNGNRISVRLLRSTLSSNARSRSRTPRRGSEAAPGYKTSSGRGRDGGPLNCLQSQSWSAPVHQSPRDVGSPERGGKGPSKGGKGGCKGAFKGRVVKGKGWGKGKPNRKGSVSGNEASNNRVYVGNLPRNIEEMEIEKLFARHGKVLGMKLIPARSGQAQASAIVRFAGVSGAEASIEAFHDKFEIIPGMPLLVKHARPNPQWEGQ